MLELNFVFVAFSLYYIYFRLCNFSFEMYKNLSFTSKVCVCLLCLRVSTSVINWCKIVQAHRNATEAET